MKKSLVVAFVLACIGLLPVATSAATDDVFNCNKNGQATSGAGSTQPLGSPYVPVADYAVELNTGLLVYKECVLRELVVSKRKAAMTAIDQQVLTQFNTGNGGEGYPSRELGREEVDLSDKTELRYLQNDALNSFNSSLQGKVKQAIASGYSNARDPRKSFECDYTGDLNQAITGTPSGNYWDAYDALTDDPACNVYSASVIGSGALAYQDAYEVYKNRERLDWGQGVYDTAHFDEYGFRITDTPGAIVLASGIQSVESGYKQMQAADDIGEMVDGLYAGVSNQILTPGSASTGGTNGGGSTGGLSALTQALGGALSYMQQVVQSATGGYLQQTADATIGILQSALATERQYNSAVASTATLFTQTNATLRTKESQCFTSIENAVCQSGTIASSTCTSLGGGTLTIVTSTGFSQKVIDANIRTLAQATVTNLNSSNQIIAAIQALIAGLTANPSQAAQTAAIASLTAINPHKSSDVSAAQQNQQNLATVMANLLSNTSTAWQEGELPAAWCNAGSQAVKDAWTQCWSGNSSACPTP